MNFLETTKRFLEPIKYNPLLYLRTYMIFTLWAINAVIHVLFIERITKYLELGDKQGFLDTIVYYVVFLIVYETLFSLTGKYGRTDTHATAVKTIHKKYLSDFIKLDNNRIEGIGTGKMVAIIRGGIDKWGNLLSLLMQDLAFIIVTFFFTLYMLLKVSYIYATIFFILYILFYISSSYFNKKVINIRRKRIEIKNMYTKNFVKILMSKFEILQSNKLEKEIETLDFYQNEEIYYNKKMSPFLNMVFRVPEGGMDIILFGVLFYFGLEFLDGKIALSVLVGLTGMLLVMKKAIGRSVDAFKNFTKDFTEVEKLWELYDTTDMITGYNTGKSFNYSTGNIEMKNITFSYNEANEKILNKFNLKIAGGKLTALVGNSGSGKSTIVKLISGYIKPNSGDIIIDNQKINDISLESYYKNIGYLTQEPSIFDGTIIDNLTYSIDGKVSKEKIDEVIKLSKCEFIYDFKDGLNTQIGERGIKLSGGQKQRLAIAKIFLKDPMIILLDEPTSALDSFSEEQITKAMNNLFKSRTVIVIAHRLQTVRHADNIFVLEKGKIIEEGTHKDLVKKKGIYNKMLELQSGF